MPAPYPAEGIVNAFLNKAAQDGQSVTHMKLQKLLYYSAGYYLAAYDKPLINRAFEAWDYGPVVPSVYQEFKRFGNQPISKPATELDWNTLEFRPAPIPTDDPRVEKVIDFVWKTYGNYPALQLSDMTHAEGTPWAITKANNPGVRNADIPNEVLKQHFATKVTRTQNA